jgi:hypothetical protein
MSLLMLSSPTVLLSGLRVLLVVPFSLPAVRLAVRASTARALPVVGVHAPGGAASAERGSLPAPLRTSSHR